MLEVKEKVVLSGDEIIVRIKNDLKIAGIKATIRRSRGIITNFAVTVKLGKNDLLGYDEYIEKYRIRECYGRITVGEGKDIWSEDFYKLPMDDREQITKAAAAYDYKYYITEAKDGADLHNFEKGKLLTLSALDMLERVKTIIQAYHYDDGDVMRDYFDTNFYYSIYIKATGI